MKGLVNASEMAAADRFTIEQLGVPGLTLMERAAAFCVSVLLPQLKQGARVTVIAGPGNNGGDGLAIARLLAGQGVAVTTCLLGSRLRLRGDALAQADRLESAGLHLCEIEEARSWEADPESEWLVDALFGTGLTRALEGEAAILVEKINAHPAKVLAVDLPSGLCGDHGRILGAHVRADLTASFQCLKYAHVVTPALFACGKVMVGDIGIQFPPQGVRAYFLEASDYQRDPRELAAHKGHCGSLAVIGGFAGMEGAGNLAGKAGLRFGAGKVRIYSDRPRPSGDSLMSAEMKDFKGCSDYEALVIGPGLSRREETFRLLDNWDFSRARVVWDADGLYYLKARGLQPTDEGEWVLTPHPGEAGALLGRTAAEVQADRLGALKALQEAYPACWILLKGYRTLIGTPSAERFVVGTGNPALATAGSGDVLAGMIGALLANGLAVEDAVVLAGLRHGMAGDHWVARYRDYAMLAEDLIEDLKY